MNELTHILDGQAIHIRLKRTAKKNIILRPLAAGRISLNIPPFLSLRQLNGWLEAHPHLLRQTLSRTPPAAMPPEKPTQIWYHGLPYRLDPHPHNHILQTANQTFLLPEQSWPEQQRHLRRYLLAYAEESLLPALSAHSQRLGLHPAAIGLSNAKTFWGICRGRTGIKLNWRLVGAPGFVQDYVCIHELCHLTHPNHSPSFWALVNRHTPHTADAKHWLKQHGRELFVLDPAAQSA